MGSDKSNTKVIVSNQQVVMSYDIQNLSGSGIEYLLDDSGSIIAVFVDGMLIDRPIQKAGHSTVDCLLLLAIGTLLVYFYGGF